MLELLKYETQLFNQGIQYIAGIDEVGRGALAGPMVVGAVILNKTSLLALNELFNENEQKPSDLNKDSTTSPKNLLTTKQEFNINNDICNLINPTDHNLTNYTQIRDSKLLTAKKRDKLGTFIQSVAVAYSIEIIDASLIDNCGISQCTQIGFFNSIKKLSIQPEHILTDQFKINEIHQDKQTNITNGDNKSITIAAASIIAKVYRDNLMINLHNQYQNYQKYAFDKHKGYGTSFHIDAIKTHGISDIHRKSFEPIKSLV